MKKLISIKLLLLMALLTALLASCKKEDGPNPAPENKQQCRIITMKYDSTFTNFNYNSEGRLQSITNSANYTTTFTYSGNIVIAVETQKGSTYYQKTTITNNESGFADHVRIELDNSGINWLDYVYDYDGNNQLIKSTFTASGTPTYIETVQWQNGNPVVDIITSASGSDTAFLEYYKNKASQSGGYFQLFQKLRGYQYVKPKNLLKSIRQKSIIQNFNYEFDTDGKISAMTIVQGSTSIRYSYQYQCN